ncbi:hypothetical protein [Agromyces sp. NPDC058104]|uniref:hypothetical protein n=1 Tax=Agromyces sp. NPDC058104 TaxID=3346342 RepID=UPI0036D8ED33
MATSDLNRRAKRARREAEDRAAVEILEWHKAEQKKLQADDSLSISERTYAEHQLLMEFGRRSKKALAKAKRDNTVLKLIEREVGDGTFRP